MADQSQNQKRRDLTTVMTWLTALRALYPGSKNLEPDTAREYAMLLLEFPFPVTLFTDRARRFVSRECSYFPSPKELVTALSEQHKNLEREAQQRGSSTDPRKVWATKILTIRNSVRASDDPWPHTVDDGAVAAAKTFLTPAEIGAIEAKATPHIPLTIDHVIDHVIRSVGPKSITRRRHQQGAGGAQDIVRTWVKKCGPERVLEAAQAHARERPLRCIPWIEDRLYGPLSDPQPVQTLINQIVAQQTTPHDSLDVSVLAARTKPQLHSTHGLRKAPEMVWSNPNAGPWSNPNK